MRWFVLAILACIELACPAQARMGPDSNYNVAILTGGGGTTVVFDAVSFSSDAGSINNFLSWTHTPAGTPTAVAVCLENYEGATTVTSATYGASSLTQNQSQAFSTFTTQCWSAANPPSGAQTVTVHYSATGYYSQAGAVTVTGSSTSTALTGSNSATATGTSVSYAVTSASNQVCYSVLGTGASSTETPGGTLRWGPIAVGGGATASGATQISTGASTTITWTLGTSTQWGSSAVCFKNGP